MGITSRLVFYQVGHWEQVHGQPAVDEGRLEATSRTPVLLVSAISRAVKAAGQIGHSASIGCT